MADVKSELRLAKEAIKKKEHKEALKHCRNVLKIEKDNYNALVFIGVCTAELEQFDRARQAYKKAIERNEEQLLAWQGLCSLLEKLKNPEYNEDLIQGYRKLLGHFSDNSKWIETCKKLLEILKTQGRYSEVVALLSELVQKCTTISEVILCQKDIIAFLEMITDIEADEKVLKILNLYKSMLSKCEKDGFNRWEKEYVSYFQWIFSNGKNKNIPALEEILRELIHVQSKLSDNAILAPLKVQTWLEYTIQAKSNFEEFGSIMKDGEVDDKLMELIHGIQLYQNDNVIEAVQSFHKALSKKICKPVAYYYLTCCYYEMHQTNKALQSLEKARQTVEYLSFLEAVNALTKNLRLLELKLLIETQVKSEEQDVILHSLCQLETDEIEMKIMQARGWLMLGKVEKSVEIIDELSNVAEKKWLAEILQTKALISVHEEKFFDAEIRLQEAIEMHETFKARFLMGQIYWKMGESDQAYCTKAYTEFLKAAKLDTHYGPSFMYLGKYQKDFIKDVKKALKCFEKAVSLDEDNEEAIMLLADTYMKMKEYEKAQAVYQKITPNAKIGTFQHAIRGNVNVSHYWECLAESYFMKGSYTSSLRAFTKAVELDPSSTACRYRIAKIKQIICLDVEAISLYEQLLAEDASYVPALQGLAETHLHREKEELKNRLPGRAVDHATEVVSAVLRAVEFQPRYTCLWKTLGDALSILYTVDLQKYPLTVPSKLLKLLLFEEMPNTIDTKLVMEVASRCYTLAIKLDERNVTYWHDLAVTSYYYGIILEGTSGREKVLQSVQLIKKALTIEPTNYLLWNTFGVIVGSPAVQERCCGHQIDELCNPSLSQHAFIKALQYNDQDAQVWCNLGALYLTHSKIEAAHEAFKRAQACNPAYAQAWIGQAIIAERISNDDAMDLYRHSTELLFHGEGSIAYAEWVCRYLNSIKDKSVLQSTVPKPDMSHLPRDLQKVACNAVVSLVKTLDVSEESPSAYNLLGVLLEHQGLFQQAERTFAQARKLLTSQVVTEKQIDQLRQVMINQARVLSHMGNFTESLEIYNIVNMASPTELCQMAIVYYKARRYQETIEAYQRALSLSTDAYEKSSILAAIGLVYYSMQDIQTAKSFLFKSSQGNCCSQHGILALCALGLLNGDATLATAALNELTKQKEIGSEVFEVKKVKLLLSYHMLQGRQKEAQRILSRAILRYPNNAELWCQMSNFLRSHYISSFTLSSRSMSIAKIKSKSKGFETIIDIIHPSFFDVPVELVPSTSKMTYQTDVINNAVTPIGSSKDLLKSAQRLIHSYPESSENWVLLATMLQTHVIINRNSERNKILLDCVKLALTKADSHLNAAKSAAVPDQKQLNLFSNIYLWMMKTYVYLHIYYGDKLLSETVCNNLLQSVQGVTQDEFVFLKCLSKIVGKEQNISSMIENMRMMSTIARKHMSASLWKILEDVYFTNGFPDASNICQRQYLQINLQKSKRSFAILARMLLLSLTAFASCKDEKYLNQAAQVIEQLLKQNEDETLMVLMRGITFYYQGNKKAALKYIQKLSFIEDAEVSQIQENILNTWK